MQHDILSDALSAIKNARRAGKKEVVIRPASNLIRDVLKVMQKENYIGEFEYIDDGKGGKFKINIKKELNNCNSIKPRFYVKKTDYLKWEKRYLPARGIGILIISTSKGVLSHHEAKEKGVGGALLAYVY
mgnify:CR=1 FL=1